MLARGGAGARAGCRVVEVAEAGGDALEEVTVAGAPESEGGRHRLVVRAPGGEFRSFLTHVVVGRGGIGRGRRVHADRAYGRWFRLRVRA